MARRDLCRHKVRAVLTCVLVALPIFVATIAALVTHNDRWDNERSAREELLAADASVTVTRLSAVRVRSALAGNLRRTPDAVRRDPSQVDLEALLPAGTTLASQPGYASATLATGGQADVLRADLSNPLTSSIVELVGGRAPTAPDEVAVPESVAKELGLLRSSGAPEEGAGVDLVDGSRLRVVGVLGSGGDRSLDDLGMLAPVDSVLRSPDERADEVRSYLVDLPSMSRAETRALATDLAAAGVALRPRDAILHPETWGVPGSGEAAIDLRPILVGAVCILVGLLEVVLLVGAAFSVAGRRQIRDLGLLATNGGAGRDVRRALLAQGLVLGVFSSLVGAALGVVAFRVGASTGIGLLGADLWRHEISWLAVAAIAMLGSLTSVIAALLPAWKLSRLTPVEALSGRFPIRPGESRAHRPAFVLAGGGLATLLAGGWATAYADVNHPRWVTATVVVAAGGLVLSVAGLVWSTPYVVRRVSVLGRALPLSGRYAFRDAGRHRFRSAAAVMALMITVAGAVLAGFAFRSAERTQEAETDLPPHTMRVDLFYGDGDSKLDTSDSAAAARLAATERTVRRIVGPIDVVTWANVSDTDGKGRSLAVRRTRDAVRVADEASLRKLVTVDEEVLAAFRAGAAVTSDPRAVRDGILELAAFPGARQPQYRWTVRAVTVENGVLLHRDSPSTYLNEDTAERLGFVTTYGTLLAQADRPITSDMTKRLSVYGIYGWSNDPERAKLAASQYAGLGVAGLLTALVIGMSVAMAAAESRDDVATLAAVGAGPWRRRGFGAMHGLFLGIVGCVLGLAVGVPAGLSFTQIDGLAGTDMPWLPTGGTALVVLLLSWVIGGVVTPSRFRLTRRTA